MRPPKWPQRALRSIAQFFVPLQDIDIFVEDSTLETVYTNFFNSILKDRSVRLRRVFQLGNKHNVIESANSHIKSGRPQVYLIDGDYEFVRAQPPPSAPNANLVRLRAYCFENLLIRKQALISVLAEELVTDEPSAEQALEWSAWLKALTPSLLEFAVLLALSNKHLSGKTSGLSLSLLIEGTPKGAELSPPKLQSVCTRLEGELRTRIGQDRLQKDKEDIMGHIEALAHPLDSLSGKDFLLPLVNFLLAKHGCKISHKRLLNRLAKQAQTLDHMELVEDLLAAARHSIS